MHIVRHQFAGRDVGDGTLIFANKSNKLKSLTLEGKTSILDNSNFCG